MTQLVNYDRVKISCLLKIHNLRSNYLTSELFILNEIRSVIIKKEKNKIMKRNVTRESFKNYKFLIIVIVEVNDIRLRLINKFQTVF